MTEPRDPLHSDATWHDLIGPTRRSQARRRLARRCWIGTDDPEPWVSRQVDRECLEMAYVLLALISPVTAPGRDRDAIIVYGALSAVFDTCATKMRAFTTQDLLKKNYRGRPIEEWAQRATNGVDDWSKNTLLTQFHRQIAQLSENRVERGRQPSAARTRVNQEHYRAYINWRVREGWYYGGLFACALASGIDLRDIPRHWMDETLEAVVLTFDIHGSLRHAYEQEIGHTLNYLPGSQHDKVSASLAAYTEILLRLQDTDELRAPEKEYLMRFVTGLITASYGCRRYNRTTALHIARSEDVAISWSHIDQPPNYRYSYDELSNGTN
ncbi:hypothetical protein [Streptomyces sp. NPDC059009]|uniref:hypothetical protein n=1 Tax=Streptomyces sp. NPDC059009 TaxID=3346694 RepID=UPI0036AAD820